MRAWPMRASLTLAAAAVALLVPVAEAPARTSALLSYPFAQVWPTAIRFLRIDRNATIREKDAESGYVLFELSDDKKVWKGALELIRTSDPQRREACRVVFTFPDLPRHFESTLLDKLAAKLREEHGEPAPPPPRTSPGESGSSGGRPDAGAGAGTRAAPSGY